MTCATLLSQCQKHGPCWQTRSCEVRSAMTSHIWHRYEVCIYNMPVLYASRENYSENKFELLLYAYLESDMRGLIIPCPVLVAASHSPEWRIGTSPMSERYSRRSELVGISKPRSSSRVIEKFRTAFLTRWLICYTRKCRTELLTCVVVLKIPCSSRLLGTCFAESSMSKQLFGTVVMAVNPTSPERASGG